MNEKKYFFNICPKNFQLFDPNFSFYIIFSRQVHLIGEFSYIYIHTNIYMYYIHAFQDFCIINNQFGYQRLTVYDL